MWVHRFEFIHPPTPYIEWLVVRSSERVRVKHGVGTHLGSLVPTLHPPLARRNSWGWILHPWIRVSGSPIGPGSSLGSFPFQLWLNGFKHPVSPEWIRQVSKHRGGGRRRDAPRLRDDTRPSLAHWIKDDEGSCWKPHVTDREEDVLLAASPTQWICRRPGYPGAWNSGWWRIAVGWT